MKPKKPATPATAEVSPDFSAALHAAGLSAFFNDCTPAHRREYLHWIGEAKQPLTRKARIEEAVKMISEKQAVETARSKKKL